MRKIAALAALMALTLAAQETRAEGNPVEGEKVFRRLCTACHIATKDGPKRLGPSLFSIVGRHSGTVEGFRYSEANKKANLTWTPEVLDVYLRDPKATIPGTIMAFAGIKKDDERANVIAYLGSLK
ncbi:MAG: c-type cytochrome [Pseudomonadota bacterium]